MVKEYYILASITTVKLCYFNKYIPSTPSKFNICDILYNVNLYNNYLHMINNYYIIINFKKFICYLP